MKNDKAYEENFNRTGCFLGMLFPIIGTGTGWIFNHKAKKNNKKAEEICSAALTEYNEVVKEFDEVAQSTKETIHNVVSLKKTIMKIHMKRFLKSYKRLESGIELKKSQEPNELQKYALDKNEFCLLEKSIQAYSKYDESRFGEKAFNIAMLMVQEGTISSLSYNIRDVIRAGKIDDEDLKRKSSDELKIESIGVIWKFSTLAFEYSLSSVSDYLDSKLAIEKANELTAELECKKEEIRIRTIQLEAISKYAKEHLKVLMTALPIMQNYVESATQIIKSKDNVFRLGRLKGNKFTEDELNKLASAYMIASAVKAVIDSPIISKTGEVADGNETGFYDVCDTINAIANDGDIEKALVT